jgi:hypothetical protein
MRFLRIICLCTGLASAASLGFAQAKGPGGAPPTGGGGTPVAPPSGSSGPGGSYPGGGGPGTAGTPPTSSPNPGAPGTGQSTKSAHSSIQFGPVGRWWDDRKVADVVGLRKEQKKRMDSIFNQNKPTILSSYKAYINEQSKLESYSKDPHTDQAHLFAAIDAVSQARAALQKATAQMFMQIRQQMDADQLEKLQKIQ